MKQSKARHTAQISSAEVAQNYRLRQRCIASGLAGAAVLAGLSIQIEGSDVPIYIKAVEGVASAVLTGLAINSHGAANDAAVIEAIFQTNELAKDRETLLHIDLHG